MKKYVLIIKEDENGIHMKRLNNGFTAFTVLGLLEKVQQEILLYLENPELSKPIFVERKVFIPNKNEENGTD